LGRNVTSGLTFEASGTFSILLLILSIIVLNYTSKFQIMPKNRSTQFKARGAETRYVSSTSTVHLTAEQSQAPAPVRLREGTLVDTATLKTLAAQLRMVSDGLLSTQEELQVTKQEAQSAKEHAEEAKALNKNLQQQIDSQQITFPPFEWKQKGNQLQWEYNYQLIADLTRTLTAIEEENAAGQLDSIAKSLRAAIASLLYRNKLIKIADTNQDGWLVVKEYVGSTVADDDEDEKHIRRAAAAAADIVKRRSESTRGAGRGGRGGYKPRGGYNQAGHYQYQQYNSQAAPQYSNQYHTYTPQQQQTSQPPVQAQGAYTAQYATAAPAASQAPRPRGGCFLCGGPHYARDCPTAKQQVSGVQSQVEAQFNKVSRA
jgi:hypothetical protein